jgi:membrane-associated PAP2 superfamily phosphatase
MYCNSCGNAVDANQAVCGRCGRVVVQPLVSRVEQHIKMLGVLWIAYAVFHAIGGMVLLIVSNTIFGRGDYAGEHAAFLHHLLHAIGMFLLVKAAVCVIAGFGLLERQSWGRTLSLVMAFIALINVPFGTAMGVYTLWVLMSPQGEVEYHRLAATAH